ncbi:MAG: HEPN domain-containing protein [Dehalococcoidia bacterium]|nr:HEPN domain-containing protein [Dehalococcoidia bacterium]
MNDAETWLAYARSHLRLAEQELAGVLYEHLCFHAQQAAETALKAVLVAHSVTPPFVHDIRLLIQVARGVTGFPDQWMSPAEGLTPYATLTRYPGAYEPVDQTQHAEAVRTAQGVVAWASDVIDAARRLSEDQDRP